MPGYNRAELSAEITVVPSPDGRESPHAQAEAARRAAGASGPAATLLAGGRAEVLEALRAVIDASLDAGAHIVEVKVEAQGDARRFQQR